MNKEPTTMEISQEDQALLKSYIKAFCNLYAITPVYRAWRIIQKQNPETAVTQEQFLDFLDGLDEEEMFCIVAGREEIYEDVDEPAPPLKREIIAQYLYAVDDFESYKELKEQQADKPFYVPDKEELLKYASDGFGLEAISATHEYHNLRDFAEKTLKIRNADDVLEDIQALAAIDPAFLSYAKESLRRIGRMKRFPSDKAEGEFYRLCKAMCDNVRTHSNRGHTSREIAILCGGPKGLGL